MCFMYTVCMYVCMRIHLHRTIYKMFAWCGFIYVDVYVYNSISQCITMHVYVYAFVYNTFG